MMFSARDGGGIRYSSRNDMWRLLDSGFGMPSLQLVWSIGGIYIPFWAFLMGSPYGDRATSPVTPFVGSRVSAVPVACSVNAKA